jgi:hypothetical protein
MPLPTTDTVIQVSALAAGPGATIKDITSYTATHGREGETRVRVFGNEDPYVKPGDSVSTYSLDGLYAPADTGGQNILRESGDDGSGETTVWIWVLHDGVSGYKQEALVTEYSDNATADGEYVEVSFSLTSVGTKTAVAP